MANPFVEDAAFWDTAVEHYQWDRLAEAYDLARTHGVGESGRFLRWFRVIEAEALTRARSEVTQPAEWLQFEAVPKEVMDLRSVLEQAALEAADEISERLGWTHGPPTLVSILAEETDAPWAVNPYGYWVPKEPYDKICLPSYLIDDLDEYRQAVAHEYAHVISSHLSREHAPRWLEEAVSVLAERQFDPEARARLAADPNAWLDAEALELMFDGGADEDQDEAEEEDAVFLAYQQAGWIGRYLAGLGDERRLGDLLRAHADESFFRNLGLILRGRSRTDGAFQRVYGMSVREAFARAREAMRGA